MTDICTGIQCPECKGTRTTVRDTREVAGGNRRYRMCRGCGNQFTTLETAVFYMEGSYQALADKVVPIAKANKKDTTADRNFWPITATDVAVELTGLPDQLTKGLLEWWNESRRSKHKTAATWTRRAFDSNAGRLLALYQGNPSRAAELVDAGLEFGWQALNVDYLQGSNKQPVAAAPSVGLAPRDPNMQAAVNQWQTGA